MQPGDALNCSLAFLKEFRQLHTTNYEKSKKFYESKGQLFTPEMLTFGIMHDLVMCGGRGAVGIIPQAIEAGVAGTVHELKETEDVLNLLMATGTDLARRYAAALFQAVEEGWKREELREEIWKRYMKSIDELEASVFRQNLNEGLKIAKRHLSS